MHFRLFSKDAEIVADFLQEVIKDNYSIRDNLEVFNAISNKRLS